MARERKNLFHTWTMLVLIVAGNVLYALTVRLFLLPAGRVT